MSRSRSEAATTMAASSGYCVGSCDLYAYERITQREQLEIAALAFEFWRAREFRNGSPQEDWLRAQRQVQKLNPLKRHAAAGRSAKPAARFQAKAAGHK